jgi:hypothetical protein
MAAMGTGFAGVDWDIFLYASWFVVGVGLTEVERA